MKQKKTAGEDQKRPIVHECARPSPSLGTQVPRRRAVRALRIDFGFSDIAQRQQRRHQQQNRDDEDGARGEITDRAHCRGRKPVADGSEAGVVRQREIEVI